jgi:chemosensory pili system protein ChpC
MNDNSQTLSCVMVPMNGRQLLLPNVTIAEVVDYVGASTVADMPEWLVGYLDWRGLQLPIISYDAANGGKVSVSGDNRGRIIILNTISDHHKDLPFLALITQGIPSQARLTEEQIRKLDGNAGPADLMEVEVDGENAWIPNLEYIEALARQSYH